MINALTHGNELCGMHVVKRLLDLNIRPVCGELTLSFANVAAYQCFSPQRLDARFLDRDFNRLWHDELLREDFHSSEARRAHEMLPVVRTVDRLLDLHSTWHALKPFFVLPKFAKTRALADALGYPGRQLFLPELRHEGYHLIDYNPFRQDDAGAVALIVECGQHFARSSVDNAWQTAVRMLQVCGVVDLAVAADLHAATVAPANASIERFEIVQPVIAESDHLEMLGSYAGFDAYPLGACAAMDGQKSILAPFDDAIVIAPRPAPAKGQQAFAWGRRVA
jgi:predicted deacylase